MGELGELRNRVDQAVDRLSTANDARRRQSQGLMTLLTDLEAKYEARNEELEHSRRRIEALARENADLSGLVEKLVVIVDTTVSADDEDPLFHATATAAELVADWSGPHDAAEPADQAEEPGQIDHDQDVPESAADDDAGDETVSSANDDGDLDAQIAAELGHDPAAEALAELHPATGFQDVSDEELASEQLDGDPDALAALLDTPLTPDIDDVVDITLARQADEATNADADPVAAVSPPPELDAGEIDMPDVDMTTLDALDGIDPIQELLAADLDIPEIALDDDEPISRIDPDEDTESSIRAMMARLEDAAMRARAHSEELSETGPEAEADEAPVVAVGGAG